MRVHNLGQQPGTIYGERFETRGLFSGSLEVVIRTDGRRWNALMAASLGPRQLEEPRNHRDRVAFTDRIASSLSLHPL